MRGKDRRSEPLFSYVNLEVRITSRHPLPSILAQSDDALRSLSAGFSAIYAPTGRSSIPLARLLRASLLRAFRMIRSERQLIERLEDTLLFRRFVGRSADDPARDETVFTKNRGRLLKADVSKIYRRRSAIML